MLLAVGILSGRPRQSSASDRESAHTVPAYPGRTAFAIAVVALPHLIATAIRYVHYRQWVTALSFAIRPSKRGRWALGALLQGTIRSAALVRARRVLILTGSPT